MNLHNIIEYCLRAAAKRSFRRILGRLEEMSYADKYVERGYSLGENSQGILFGNWNHWGKYEGGQWVLGEESKMFKRIGSILEKVADLDWHDEWTTCDDCGGAVRTNGNCWQWQPCYVVLDCEIICRECVGKHAEDVLLMYEGAENKALSADLGLDPAEHGYKLAQADFENGWHGGQDADPKVIAKTLSEKDVNRFLFMITDVGQFDLKFALYIHEEDYPKFKKLTPKEHDGPDRKAMLKEGLKAASVAIAYVPPGEGPVVVKVEGGQATAKRVSKEDFVNGKALE